MATYNGLYSVDRKPPFAGVFITPLIFTRCMLPFSRVSVKYYYRPHAIGTVKPRTKIEMQTSPLS